MRRNHRGRSRFQMFHLGGRARIVFWFLPRGSTHRRGKHSAARGVRQERSHWNTSFLATKLTNPFSGRGNSTALQPSFFGMTTHRRRAFSRRETPNRHRNIMSFADPFDIRRSNSQPRIIRAHTHDQHRRQRYHLQTQLRGNTKTRRLHIINRSRSLFHTPTQIHIKSDHPDLARGGTRITSPFTSSQQLAERTRRNSRIITSKTSRQINNHFPSIIKHMPLRIMSEIQSRSQILMTTSLHSRNNLTKRTRNNFKPFRPIQSTPRTNTPKRTHKQTHTNKQQN